LAVRPFLSEGTYRQDKGQVGFDEDQIFRNNIMMIATVHFFRDGPVFSGKVSA